MKQGWSSFMDRRVKERLVGATILVILIVLIVPELLSGPKRAATPPPPLLLGPVPAEPVRNVTVDLATSKATQADGAMRTADDTAASVAASAAASAAGAPPPDAAASGAAAPLSSVPEAKPGVEPTIATLKAQQEPVPALANDDSSPKLPETAKPVAQRAAEPAGAGHRSWAVQLGSFASRANADKLARQLRAQGSAMTVSSSGSGKALRFRVRMGPMTDRGAAERTAAKLRSQGHAASVVTPAS
jgi:DedD protein